MRLKKRIQPHDIYTYMLNMETAMISYPVAGIKPAPSTTGVVVPEVRGVKSITAVQVPLDIVMRYLYRARARIARMPLTAALAWLQKKDEQERGIWVDKYRNSTDTLGTVIHETMMQREAMWEVEKVSKPIQLPLGPTGVDEDERSLTSRPSRTAASRRRLGARRL